MAKKVVPQKTEWTDALEAQFVEAGFQPAIIQELKTLGEVYQIDSLTVVARPEMMDSESFEVVWMATLGKDLAKWSKVFFDGAKRNGAKAIRFHIADEEKALIRLLKSWKPQKVEDARLDGLVYRVMLEG